MDCLWLFLKDNLTSILTLITAIGAVGAAIGAWKSAKEARKTSLAQIITKLMDDYSSPEMYDAMLNLSEFKNNFPSDFRAKFAGEIRQEPIPPKYLQYDADRRRVSHYFHKIWRLLDTNLLTEEYVVKVITRSQANFYLNIVEPLDRAKAQAIGEEYDPRCYNTFSGLYDKLK